MVEAILLQIPSPIREALRVHMTNHHDHIMYVEHVLLHSRPPSAGPHTRSLSWHHSHACYRMSSPCASADSAWRYPCLHPVCEPISRGTHGDWQRCEGACLPHHTARGRRPHQTASVYVTSTPGSVDLKIGISNLAGASHFFSLLPLRPLHLCQQPAVSLAVEYPSESGATLSGEEGGKPPPSTTVHWVLGGCLCSHAATVREVSLASATSSTAEALPACWGALPTSWAEESDSPAFTTAILWTGFSARPLSLWQLEAATARHHTSIRGKRLMVKWAECEIHSEKASSMWVWMACTVSCLKPQQPCML